MRTRDRRATAPDRSAAALAALLLPALAWVGCGGWEFGSGRASAPPFIEAGDLEQIRARGTLRVLLPLLERRSYLPRGHDVLEAERELVEAFARRQGLEPYWIHVASRSDLIPYLLEGKGDLIAANLTATDERRSQVAFTVPVGFAREQLVTRRGDDGLHGPADLAGRRVAVRPSSSFRHTLEALRARHPEIAFEEVPEHVDTDEILHRVATRRLDVTIADSNLVEAALAYRDDLRVAFDVGPDRPIAWAVRRESRRLLAGLNLFLAEDQLSARHARPAFGDLGEIRERRVLRVLTRNSPATYFLWRGELMGFEYELARRFAREHDLRLEIVVPRREEDLVTMLVEGRGDLVAAALARPGPEEEREVALSVPYHYVAPTVVARAGEDAPLTPQDLAGRAIHVRRDSPHWELLDRLRREHGFALHAAPDTLDAEEIIALVADGTYDLTVAPSHVVDIETTWRSDVRAALVLGDPVPLAWAVRGSNPELLAAVDRFLRREYRGLFYNVIYDKYFRDPKKILRHQQYRARAGELSPYDRLVRTHAELHGFDWRLIVAQIYQESEFDPLAQSFAGAVGLLQVLPTTAEQLGLERLEDPEANIAAGIRYLSWLRERFDEELPYWERMWFALAAYNVGHGHVVDARRLAARLGLDPDRWFGNVERAMLLLSRPEHAREARHGYCRGGEPVHYVREIRSRYESYLATLGQPDAPAPRTERATL